MALGETTAFPEWRVGLRQSAGTEVRHSCMSIFDLIKATVVCGAIAFLIYSYPVLGQIVLIGFLSLLWLLYAHQTIANLRRR